MKQEGELSLDIKYVDWNQRKKKKEASSNPQNNAWEEEAEVTAFCAFSQKERSIFELLPANNF